MATRSDNDNDNDKVELEPDTVPNNRNQRLSRRRDVDGSGASLLEEVLTLSDVFQSHVLPRVGSLGVQCVARTCRRLKDVVLSHGPCSERELSAIPVCEVRPRAAAVSAERNAYRLLFCPQNIANSNISPMPPYPYTVRVPNLYVLTRETTARVIPDTGSSPEITNNRNGGKTVAALFMNELFL